jgi:2-aminoadipate transaminase
MNVWVRLPEPLDASELAPRAEREGVSYLPGRYFAVTRPHTHELRLSFAGLAPDKIRVGMAALGKIFRSELERAHGAHRHEPAPAVV